MGLCFLVADREHPLRATTALFCLGVAVVPDQTAGDEERSTMLGLSDGPVPKGNCAGDADEMNQSFRFSSAPQHASAKKREKVLGVLFPSVQRIVAIPSQSHTHTQTH
ncbi:hypothetical protein GJ744_007403 [Endocarpon pusillum]|uniref:Uncharacterized protein n=1 Tax=Endocarpon pusillum TaxID=364733 RepID=A0A8H7E5B8_9EURO|nr:hypothetical protein GJ744_007403 [Endocarpon pusillum]